MHKSRSGGSLANSASSSAGSTRDSCAGSSGTGVAAASGGGGGGGGGHSSRILAKKIWKNRSKSQSRASASSTCIWTPQGSCKWTSITGRQVVLTATTLLHLTELETVTLHKVALAKLQALNLGVTIRPPHSVSSDHKPKRRAHLLRKRALSGGGFFDTSKKDSSAKNSGQSTSGLVFGVPLDQCIANERKAKLRKSQSTELNEESSTSGLTRKPSYGSRTSFGSLNEGIKPEKGGSCESLDTERNRSSSLTCSLADELIEETSISSPRVPNIVATCFQHLEAHGLETLGIFRVSSSKKRVRQLREHFDTGNEVQLNEDCCSHDIATLLKEFFRDLPEPLLTRELYPAFVQTQKVRNRRLQLESLQHLIQLLPIASRDTLYFLLSFLSAVADKSSDRRAPNGDLIPGNKMDSNNLATLFAPNILHMVKAGTSPEKMAAESRADERIDVINVVRCMIDHYKELFELSAELLDEIYIHMMDTHPEALDRLLRRRCQNEDTHEDVDTGSSVFEGSERSSLPRTPTCDESFDSTYQKIARKNSQTMENANFETSDQRRYRKREEILHENGGTGGRYMTATTRERRYIDRSKRMTEPSRSRTDPSVAVHHYAAVSRHHQILTDGRPQLSRERSEPTIERRIIVQPVPQQPLNRTGTKEPEPMNRRLSSPVVDTSGVITASLKIPVAGSSASRIAAPLPQAGRSFTVDDEHDIPYIEDTSSSQDDSLRKDRTEKRQHKTSVTSLKNEPRNPEILQRQRSCSTDSFAGQPMIGSMQVVTSVVSNQTVSNVVSSVSGKKSSGTQDSVPVSPGGSTSSVGIATSATPSIPLSGVVRSKTVDIEKMIASSKTTAKKTGTKEEAKLKEDETQNKKKTKRKYMGTRNHTDFLPEILSRSTSKSSVPQDSTTRGKMTAVLRKRWEIISSNSGASETFL